MAAQSCFNSPGQFNVDRVEGNEKGRALLEDAINKTLGVEAGAYRVKAILKGAALPSRSAQAKLAQGLAPKAVETIQSPAASDAPGPFVEKVIAVFGGQLLDDEVNH